MDIFGVSHRPKGIILVIEQITIFVPLINVEENRIKDNF